MTGYAQPGLASNWPYLEDGVQHKLAESSHVSLSSGLVPLPVLWAVELVSPQSLHELGRVDLELLRVNLGELLEGERPAMQTGAKPHRAFARVNLGARGGQLMTAHMYESERGKGRERSLLHAP